MDDVELFPRRQIVRRGQHVVVEGEKRLVRYCPQNRLPELRSFGDSALVEHLAENAPPELLVPRMVHFEREPKPELGPPAPGTLQAIPALHGRFRVFGCDGEPPVWRPLGVRDFPGAFRVVTHVDGIRYELEAGELWKRVEPVSELSPEDVL